MSQEDVKIIKRFVAAGHRGDWEAALGTYDAAVEFDASRMLGGSVGVGPRAVLDFFRQWFGTWNRLSIAPERFIDLGDRVLVVVRLSGVGKGSGIATSMRVADVYTLRDGKIVRHVGYADAAEALEAEGLTR